MDLNYILHEHACHFLLFFSQNKNILFHFSTLGTSDSGYNGNLECNPGHSWRGI